LRETLFLCKKSVSWIVGNSKWYIFFENLFFLNFKKKLDRFQFSNFEYICVFFSFYGYRVLRTFPFFIDFSFFFQKKRKVVSMNVERVVPFLFPRKFFWRKTTGKQPVTSFFFLDLSKYMYFFFLCLIQEQLDVFHYG
jgi:hypothetical protein